MHTNPDDLEKTIAELKSKNSFGRSLQNFLVNISTLSIVSTFSLFSTFRVRRAPWCRGRSHLEPAVGKENVEM